MLRRLIDAHPNFRDEFIVLFCNTGREHEKTLEFVHRVETEWQIPIVWLEYRRVPAVEIDPLLVPAGRKRLNLLKASEVNEATHWFALVEHSTAARRCDFGPFDEMLEWANGLPNVRTRRCSVQLKIRTMQRYLFSLGIYDFVSHIGIRADEAHRKLEILCNLENGEHPEFPLIDAGTTNNDVTDFWGRHPFTLDIPAHEGNCDGCFLKARWKRLKFAKEDPQNAAWWARKESEFAARGVTGDGAIFRKGQPYSEIIRTASLMPVINEPKPKAVLPKVENLQFNFTEEDEDIPCSCAVGGFRLTDEDSD